MKVTLRRGAMAACCLLASCAWTVRDNRPVWNALESTVVPESDGAFYAMLPVTVPLGLVAILLDTFVAHPIQVVDDAWDDSCELWEHIDLEGEFYTESALLPVRTVATPVWFVGSFLGRSCFDLPSSQEQGRRQEEAAARRRSEALAWLAKVAAGRRAIARHWLEAPYDDELRQAVRRALDGGSALGRIRVYQAVARCDEPRLVDWNAALADPSAVVRYHVIDELPKSFALPTATRSALLGDPDEAVRQRAQRRWPQ